MRAKTTWLWWSSGKDSAWSLHVLQNDPRYDVTRLVTTVTDEFQRVAMHAVRVELLRRQAAAAGLDLLISEIPYPCPNERYAQAVHKILAEARRDGVECMAFGDLFLEDIRAYREGLLERTEFEPVFPLWGRDTRQLADEMIAGGLVAYVTCIDPKVLPAEFAGRRYDARFLEDLPAGVDPCGENGEFHTFVCEGPMFAGPIPVQPGEREERDGFVFGDVVATTD